MYLSRIKLNTAKRNTQIALASPNKIHGAIEESFGQKQERNLWRVDKLYDEMYLLLLSVEKPDLGKIINQFGFPDDVGEIKDYNALLNQVSNGTKWHFRLVANPTRSVKKADDRGKVVAHVSEKYQMEWLHKKAIQNGFKIVQEETQIIASKWIIFHKKNQVSKVRIKAVSFEGIVEVQNAELCKIALLNGVGREKAYGMGLLTLIKV